MGGSEMKAKELARYIDHTLLKPVATEDDVRKAAREAVEWGCFSICVNLARLPAAVEVVSGTKVIPCCVTSFPLGAAGRRARIFETEEAVRSGAREIDTVIDLGLVKGRKWKEVVEDLRAQVDAAGDAKLKVIIETCFLEREEKLEALEACIEAGAEFVKTSTGFGLSGATIEDIRLLKEAARGRIKIKASGGIGTYEQAIAMIDAGAARLGMSRTGIILEQAGP